jgi:hypothetical protein
MLIAPHVAPTTGHGTPRQQACSHSLHKCILDALHDPGIWWCVMLRGFISSQLVSVPTSSSPTTLALHHIHYPVEQKSADSSFEVNHRCSSQAIVCRGPKVHNPFYRYHFIASFSGSHSTLPQGKTLSKWFGLLLHAPPVPYAPTRL